LKKKELYIIISLIGLSIASFFSTLLTFVSPLPVAFAFRKFKVKMGFIVLTLSFAGVAAVGGIAYAIGFLLIAGTVGVVAGLQLSKAKEKINTVQFMYRTLGYAVVIFLITGSIFTVGLERGSTSDISAEIGNQIDSVYKNAPKELSVMGLSGKKYSGKSEIKEYLLSNMYSFIIVALIVMVVINVFFMTGLFPDVLDRQELFKWRVPSWYIWIMLAAGFSLVLSYGGRAVVQENIFRVVLLPYFFQGLAIVAFYLQKKQFPGFLRIVIIVTLSVFMVIPSTVVGFVDHWLNFRKPKKIKST
jgi:hypothetical protein